MKKSRMDYWIANPCAFVTILYALLLLGGSIGGIRSVVRDFKMWGPDNKIILSGIIENFCSTKAGTYVISVGDQEAEVQLMNFQRSYLVCGKSITVSENPEYGQEVFDDILDSAGVSNKHKTSFLWRSGGVLLFFIIGLICVSYIVSFYCFVEKKLRERDSQTDSN